MFNDLLIKMYYMLLDVIQFGTCASGSPSQENRLPTGRSSPTPTPRRARERSSPPIGSQPMGVGESCYSVPSLVLFPLVRACSTTLHEAQQWVSQAVLLFAAGGAGTKVPEPARDLGRRPKRSEVPLGRVPWSGPRGEPNAEGRAIGSRGAAPLRRRPHGLLNRALGPRSLGPYEPWQADPPAPLGETP